MEDISSSVKMLSDISTAHSRAKTAEQTDKNKKSDILVGVVIDPRESFQIDVLNGIGIACAEINENGGVFGRKIRLLEKHVNDSDRVVGSENVTQELIWNKEVVAVIGGIHYDQFVNIAPLCEFNGLLLISPTLTAGIIPYQKEFKFVFVNFPNIRQLLNVIYNFLEINGLKYILVISSTEFHYGYYFSNAFERFSVGEIHVLYRQIMSLNSDIKQVLDLNRIEVFKKMNKFDGVLLGTGNEKMLKEIIGYLQELHFIPVCVFNDEMERKEIAKLKMTENIRAYLPSTYDPDSDKPAVKQFKDIYKKKFGEFPDTWAAQGYDTMKVLAAAMKSAHSTVPFKVATELHKIKYTENVTTAPYLEFDQAGELSSGQPIMKYIEDGQFKVLRNMKMKPAN